MKAFLRPLSACLAAGIVAWSGDVLAQSQIQFSVPTGNDKVDPSSSLTPGPATKRLNVKDYNAPPTLFGMGYTPHRSLSPLPMGPSYDDSAVLNSLKWKQFLETKRNWALSTPEDILGMQTPEKILGLESATDERRLSPEQRFLNRQNSRATNGIAGYNMRDQNDSTLSIFGEQNKLLRPDQVGQGGTPAGSRSSAFGSVNPGRNAGYFSASKAIEGQLNQHKSDSPAWGNTFNLPAPLEKPSVDEQASMDRFRSLLDPSLSPEKVAEKTTAKSFDSGFGGTKSGGAFGTPVDPFMQLPPVVENPAGRSYQSLADNATRPMGIKPLPSITQGGSKIEKKTAPLVQLPPWLRKDNNGYKYVNNN